MVLNVPGREMKSTFIIPSRNPARRRKVRPVKNFPFFFGRARGERRFEASGGVSPLMRPYQGPYGPRSP